MMFSLRYRILMCAAFCILSSTSSNAGENKPQVSLTCNKTREAAAGQSLTLNCTIQLPLEEDCRGEEYAWEDPNNIICDGATNSGADYTCEWDSETYVSLLIRNVTESQNYTVHIWTVCGCINKSTVEVKLCQVPTEGSPEAEKVINTPPNPPQVSSMVTVIASVFIILFVLGILSALLLILKCVKREKNPESMDASQACLVNSSV